MTSTDKIRNYIVVDVNGLLMLGFTEFVVV